MRKKSARKGSPGRPPRTGASDDGPRENKSVNLTQSELRKIEEAMAAIDERKLGAFIRAAALERADQILAESKPQQEMIDGLNEVKTKLVKLQKSVETMRLDQEYFHAERIQRESDGLLEETPPVKTRSESAKREKKRSRN